MPNLASSPAIVPTKESCGCSGSFGFGGAIAFATVTVDCGGGVGGRRKGRKIGRSRVTENCLTGIAHSGLALSGRSADGPGAPGGMVTSTTDVVGSLQIEGTAPSGFAP